MDNSKEYIVAAAYKLLPMHDNFPLVRKLIFKHPSIRKTGEIGGNKYDDIYSIRIGRHHAEILHLYGDIVDHLTDGFYTSWGRWVDRYQAARIAINCGQCKENELIMGDRLDSSDIFK